MHCMHQISRKFRNTSLFSKSGGKYEFDTAISYYREYIKNLPVENQIYALDFMLDMVKTELQTEFIKGLFYDYTPRKNSLDNEILFPNMFEKEIGEEIETNGETYLIRDKLSYKTEKVCDYRVALIFALSKLKMNIIGCHK